MENNGKQITTGKAALQAKALGYSIHHRCVDSFGRRWAYRTFPMVSGPVGQFSNITQVLKYFAQIEEFRYENRAEQSKEV